MTSRFACALLVSAAACGSSNNNTKPVDAAPVVPAHITVTGTTKAQALSSTSLAGVTVGAYQNSDENTAVATATSDQNGNYTLDITTNGQVLDGYVKGSISGYLDTYLYPPAPLAADYNGAALNLVTESTLGTLSTFCGDGITSAMGAVGIEVVDKTGTVVAGAALSATPAPKKYCYNGQNGIPSSASTVTNADGLGYLVEVLGSVDVTATLSGSTFATHKINVRAGTLTTTLVQGQ